MRKFVLFVSFLALIFGTSLFVTPKRTFAGWSPLSVTDFHQGEWLQTSMTYIINGAVCGLADKNYTKTNGDGCLTVDGNGRWQKSDGKNGGAMRVVGTMMANLYNPPASGIYYFADLGKNFGIAKPAYAQGTGFAAVSGLLVLWKAFRNLAYIIFVIAFLFIGFAIMFRIKLDPRTVISIESIIPKLIITLLLITFSYAIAGLLIDLAYVVIGIGVLALDPIGHWGTLFGPDLPAAQEKFMRLGFLDMLGTITGGLLEGVFNLGGVLGKIFIGMAGVVALLFPPAAPVIGVSLLVVAAILLFIVFYVMLKLFFSLLSCYISIVFYIIFSPLLIAAGAIPGVPGFGSWLKNLAANIFVFPVIALYFALALIFTSDKALITWTPPGFGFTGSVSALIGLGMILMSPKIPQAVKDAFGVKPFKYGDAIGEPLAPARGMIGGSVSEYGKTKGSSIGKGTFQALGGMIAKG